MHASGHAIIVDQNELQVSALGVAAVACSEEISLWSDIILGSTEPEQNPR
jgi:hypothetical protein